MSNPSRRALHLLVLLFTLSCTSDPIRDSQPVSDFRYPMEVGNRWVYARTGTAEHLDTGTNEILYASIDTCEVIRREGMNTWDAYILEHRYHDESFSDNRSWDWYANTEAGLYNVAYSHPSGGTASPSPANKLYKAAGRVFRSRNALLKALLGEQSSDELSEDSIRIQSPPVLSYSYMHDIGQSWWSFRGDAPFHIQKRLLGYWPYYTKLGTFMCHVVRSEYFDSDNGEPMYDIGVTDYISQMV